MIECVTGGTYAVDADPDVKNEIVKAYKDVLGIGSWFSVRQLEEVHLTELLGALEADNLIDRIAHRKLAGPSEKKKFLKLKGTYRLKLLRIATCSS